MTVHRRRPEDSIQRAVCQHLLTRASPRVVWWHTPNGGMRNRIEAAIMKGLGIRAGVSDLIAVHQGRAFALELKAEGGRATEAQLAFIAGINAAGGYAAVATGIDAALRCCEAWKLLLGKAS